MPLAPVVDWDAIDPQAVAFGPEAIRAVNPQRGDMEHLDAVVAVDPAGQWAVGRKDVRPDEFWVPGHIPGRPLLPGVVMLEASAQLCSFLYKRSCEAVRDRFIGFAGLEGVRFRATVRPGDRLLLAARVRRTGRIWEFDTQGRVGDRVAFEARVLGTPV